MVLIHFFWFLAVVCVALIIYNYIQLKREERAEDAMSLS